MKDNFSTQASIYAQFRPGYPAQLFDFLCDQCEVYDCAWDCAAGNGQMAAALAQRFRQVEATDISEKQLAQAIRQPNIRYSMEAAETPSFPDGIFDLVVVGQAAHWFDLDTFYRQADRMLKPGGVLALVGYNLLRIDAATDTLIDQFYTGVLGKYWDAERRLVDEAYAGLPFPFPEIGFPEMFMQYEWSVDHLLGYLNTWSALQHYVRENGRSPLDEAFLSELRTVWPKETAKTVRFPIFWRIGRKDRS